MINYVRNTDKWAEALSIHPDHFDMIAQWGQDMINDHADSLSKLRGKVHEVFNNAKIAVKEGKSVSVEGVVEDADQMLRRDLGLHLNHLVEDAEITLLSKGFMANPIL